MKYVDRKDLPSYFQDMMKTESHHDHKIVEVYGKYRWEEFIDSDKVNMNEVVMDFYNRGLNKNSEEYRQFYRDIGYSLDGYWEVFYWDMNNDILDQYVQPITK